MTRPIADVLEGVLARIIAGHLTPVAALDEAVEQLAAFRGLSPDAMADRLEAAAAKLPPIPTGGDEL